VAADRAALQEYTRERVPLDWAHTQHALANALAVLAARLKDPARAQEAIACMRGAIEVYRKGGESNWLPIAERRVDEMEAELSRMQKGAP
jgi:hypothetical protein